MVSSLTTSCVGLLFILLPYCTLAIPIELGSGMDFILGISGNTTSKPRLYIVTASSEPVLVTVTTPLHDPYFVVNAVVIKGNRTIIDLHPSVCGDGTEEAGKGVFVNASREVSVYAANTQSDSVDAFQAWPTHALGKKYYAMTHIGYPVLLVVASKDNTNVKIRCSIQTGGTCLISYGGVTSTSTNGEIVTVRLNKFKTFHVYTDSDTADFSGVYIQANRHVSVISGNRMMGNVWHHQAEHMPPVERWGTRFNTPNTTHRNPTFNRIVASRKNTVIYFYDGTTENLDKGNVFQTDAILHAQAIRTNKPVMMALFTSPSGADGAMTLIVPERMYTTEVQWSTVRTYNGTELSNDVDVIVEKSKLSGLRLDDNPVDWQGETTVLGNPSHVHVFTNVTYGAHDLRHVDSRVTFMVLAFGVLSIEDYEFPTGGRVYRCIIAGDPRVINYMGRSMGLPYPCQYRVTFVRFIDLELPNATDVSEMEVDVSACNGLIPLNGRYYVEAVLISVTFITTNGTRLHVGNFNTDKSIIDAMKGSGTASPAEFWTKQWATSEQSLRNEIEFIVDPDFGKVTFSFLRVSMSVGFQPYNDQGAMPGLFVELGSDAIVPDSALFPATVCSTLNDARSPVLPALGNHITLTTAGLYACLSQSVIQALGTTLGKAMCTEVRDYYHQDCTPLQRDIAVSKCSRLVRDPQMLHCMSKFQDTPRNILPAQGGFGVFRACMRAICKAQELNTYCAIMSGFDAFSCKGKPKRRSMGICSNP